MLAHAARRILTRVPLVALALASSAAHAVQPLTAPANDECAGAVAIPDGPYPVVSTVTRLTEATPDGVDSGELPGCPDLDHTVWYSFTPSVSSFYRISTCQGNGATGSTVYDTIVGVLGSTGGSCPAATVLACNNRPAGCTTVPPVPPVPPYWDQAITVAPLTGGETYFIVAGHWAPNAGGVAAPWDDIAVQIDKVPSPPNDTCTSPVPLALNKAVRGTTVYTYDDYHSTNCYTGVGNVATSALGRDAVFSFTAPADGKYSVRYIQDATEPPLLHQDFVLYASNSCPPSGSNVSCFAGANRVGTSVTPRNKSEELYCMTLTSGQTIYVFFDNETAGNDGGVFDLEVIPCNQENEPNDTQASATPLACTIEGSTAPLADIDFISLGTPPAGSRVFAGIDASQAGDNDWKMRVTNATDTLQYDDNDGTSLVGYQAPVIGGVPTDGTPTYIRLSHSARLGSAPFHLVTRVETGPAQVESEPNDAGNGNMNYFTAEPLTGGGYVRGVASSSRDIECFRFVGYEGQEMILFSGANPDRVPGAIVDMWPTLYDLSDSGYNGLNAAGQVARNLLAPTLNTLIGNTPSITSEFWTHRLRYTGTQVVCWSPLQATGAYPLAWHGNVSLDCNPVRPASDHDADVSIKQTGPVGPVSPGGLVTYTFEVTNRSSTDIAQDVRIADDFPPQVTAVQSHYDDGFGMHNLHCLQVNSGFMDCINYSIAPGATTTWTFVAKVSTCLEAGTEIRNTVNLVSTSSVDGNAANNSSTWTFTTSPTPPPPAPVGPTLQVAKQGGTDALLTWTAESPFTAWNLYRGSVTRPFTYNEGCLEAWIETPTAVDSGVPASGVTFYYLVSATNGCEETASGQATAGPHLPLEPCQVP